MEIPETRYARSGDVSIAYQVFGEGPFDLVFVPGAFSHVDLMWGDERRAAYFRALGSFARVIAFDKRGTGASDHVDVADLESRMDDVRAVMDDAGSARAAVMGSSEGGPMSMLFAATYPERTRALVLYGTFARGVWAPDYPWRPTRAEKVREIDEDARAWATPETARWYLHPDDADDPEKLREEAVRMRMMASPGAVAALGRMNLEIDVRHILRSIRVPTLVLHRLEDHISIDNARFLGREIPGARLVELPGGPHVTYLGDWQAVVREVESFLVPLAAVPDDEPETESVLATVLFTDIVGSTAKAASVGDRAWRELLDRHHSAIRAQLSRFRGRELDTAGDGFFASFDGPARAVRCACAIRGALGELDLEVRVGLHTGECEVLDGKVAGIAVSIGARVAAEAGPGEVLVSQTVKDLVAGSGITFESRGVAELKGVPGEWQLYAVGDA
ncbi:MAG: adenylate/guanylate cyclase domain-containing protein [Thermoleophilia bacterium]